MSHRPEQEHRLLASPSLDADGRLSQQSGPLSRLLGCFTHSWDLAESVADSLAQCIQCGNTSGLERILQKLPVPPAQVRLTVKRRHLSPDFVTWTNRNQDPFLHFHQECSPVVWAVDNEQWQMLPVLARYGFDPNRPTNCRRWCFPNSSSNRAPIVPYKKFWTRGRYTYQSALDYYFGSIYEFLDEEAQSATAPRASCSAPSSFHHFFQQLPQLLLRGLDVHRIDSIMLFNSLGFSLNRYLTRYTNPNNTVPDLPELRNSCAELYTVQALTRSGFSQFECLEFLSSSHSLLGTLICLLCHPRLDSFADCELPPIIREAALLLINLLSLRPLHPTCDEIRDSLENQSLRKLYAKRYWERRQQFRANLGQLTAACKEMSADKQPMSLCLLARNAVRRRIGGANFLTRVRRLPDCPAEVAAFISYLDDDCLRMLHRIPSTLLMLAKGVNPFGRLREDRNDANGDDTKDRCADNGGVPEPRQ